MTPAAANRACAAKADKRLTIMALSFFLKNDFSTFSIRQKHSVNLKMF